MVDGLVSKPEDKGYEHIALYSQLPEDYQERVHQIIQDYARLAGLESLIGGSNEVGHLQRDCGEGFSFLDLPKQVLDTPLADVLPMSHKQISRLYFYLTEYINPSKTLNQREIFQQVTIGDFFRVAEKHGLRRYRMGPGIRRLLNESFTNALRAFPDIQIKVPSYRDADGEVKFYVFFDE